MPMNSFDVSNVPDLFFIFRQSELLVCDTPETRPPVKRVAQRCLEQNCARDWFTEPQFGYSALLLEDDCPTPSGCRWIRLRTLFYEGSPVCALACRALGLLNWRKSSRFCGYCGSAAIDDKYETARRCTLCGRLLFPRISPAVIVLVRRGDSILLARHSQRNTDIYTCLAGYVEHGESLEECVVREVREETALEICDVQYAGSQCWPYPDQLMAAFYAQYSSGDILIQSDELDDAAWFRLDSLPSLPKPGTVAFNLISGALKETRG